MTDATEVPAQTFSNPYDCDKCAMFQTFCSLHRKMEAAKGRTAYFEEDCPYCRKRGGPCTRHGGEPSYTAPTENKRIPKSPPVKIEQENTNGKPVAKIEHQKPTNRVDDELQAIGQIVEAIEGQPREARSRILTYVKNRFEL